MTEYKKSLPQLFFPIFFENFFAMLTGMVDTLMLSMEGDQAVGAVGTAIPTSAFSLSCFPSFPPA